MKPLDSGLGFSILRRPTTYIHVGVRRSDVMVLIPRFRVAKVER